MDWAMAAEARPTSSSNANRSGAIRPSATSASVTVAPVPPRP